MEPDNNKLTPELVLMAIQNGILDDSLPVIETVLEDRIEILQARAAANLEPGDQFHITRCSPKKWNDVLVEFVKRDGIWLVCNVVHYYDQTALKVRDNQVRLRPSHVGTIISRASSDDDEKPATSPTWGPWGPAGRQGN